MSVLAVGVLLGLAAAQAAPAIEGRWANPSRSVIVDIADCGSAMCGTVTWASAKAQQDARKGTDRLVGTPLLTNLQPRGPGWRGKLFVPDQNMRVAARLQLVGEQLKVSGCAMGKALCKAALWTRLDGPLPGAE